MSDIPDDDQKHINRGSDFTHFTGDGCPKWPKAAPLTKSEDVGAILSTLASTAFCLGQDWTKGSGNELQVEAKAEEAKSQILQLIEEARIDELEGLEKVMQASLVADEDNAMIIAKTNSEIGRRLLQLKGKDNHE